MILYGSLYPFHFHGGVTAHQVFSEFFALRPEHLERGDVVSNILLYLPLGLFAVLALPGRSPVARVLAITLAGSALAVSIELTQSFDYGRNTSIVDAMMNALGTLIGALAGVILHRDLAVLRRINWHPFAILMLFTWIGNRLLPDSPSFDVHRYSEVLKSLLAAPPLHPLDVYKQFALWLAAAAMLDALLGTERSRFGILALLAVVFAARVALGSTVLLASEVTGGILAAILWIVSFSRLRSRTIAIAVLFVIFVALEALRPFHFASTPRNFTWTPFLGFIDGPRGSAVRSFLEKAYIYGALVWLLARAGCSYLVTAISAFALVFSLRLIQVYIPGRSAEIADALMVLILVVVMWLIEPRYRAPHAPYPPGTAAPIPR